MTERNTVVQDAMDQRADMRLRRLLAILGTLVVMCLVIASVAVWYALDQRSKAAQAGVDLATRVQAECTKPLADRAPVVLGLCDQADSVVKDAPNALDPDDAEIQDPEIQDAERDDPEAQDPEIQDRENQDPEPDDPEVQDPENQDPEANDQDPNDPDADDPETQESEVQDDERDDPEPDDAENQDPEVQDDEIQDPEVQDPERDDPDPASPFVFTFTIVIPSDIPNQPPHTYVVTCDSGSGECTTTAT